MQPTECMIIIHSYMKRKLTPRAKKLRSLETVKVHKVLDLILKII